MLIKVKKNIVREMFYFWSAVLALFLVLESLWPGSVLAYLNINYLLIIWVTIWLLLI